jgi:hypothetical protein
MSAILNKLTRGWLPAFGNPTFNPQGCGKCLKAIKFHTKLLNKLRQTKAVILIFMLIVAYDPQKTVNKILETSVLIGLAPKPTRCSVSLYAQHTTGSFRGRQPDKHGNFLKADIQLTGSFKDNDPVDSDSIEPIMVDYIYIRIAWPIQRTYYFRMPIVTSSCPKLYCRV